MWVVSYIEVYPQLFGLREPPLPPLLIYLLGLCISRRASFQTPHLFSSNPHCLTLPGLSARVSGPSARRGSFPHVSAPPFSLLPCAHPSPLHALPLFGALHGLRVESVGNQPHSVVGRKQKRLAPPRAAPPPAKRQPVKYPAGIQRASTKEVGRRKSVKWPRGIVPRQSRDLHRPRPFIPKLLVFFLWALLYGLCVP